MSWIEHTYPDTSALVTQVSHIFEEAARQAIAQRGCAFFSLAGGRTPLPIYAHLASAGLNGPLLALPGDDRCVPHDHPACNWRNLRDAFYTDPQIQVQPLTTVDGASEASLTQSQHFLAQHPEAFDAVLIGMGADGHFASLFPGAANLQQGLARDSGLAVIATTPNPLPPEAPFSRISLTLPRLLHAREVHVVVTGQDKYNILQQAKQNASAPYPIATLLHASPTPTHIHWSP